MGTRKNGKGTGKWLILLFAGTNSQRGCGTDYRHKIRFFFGGLRSCRLQSVWRLWRICGDGIWYVSVHTYSVQKYGYVIVQYIPCVSLWANKGVCGERKKKLTRREMTMLLLLVVW